MKVALLTYSTRPRGGVVHTLALAEALARRGHAVTVHTLGRGGDQAFYRAVDPAVSVAVTPFVDVPGETVGERVLRSIAALRDDVDPAPYDVVHAQDCISANAMGRCIRTVHHLDAFTTPELVECHDRAIRLPYAHICVSEAVAAELLDEYGVVATVIPNGVDAERFERAGSADPVAVAARERWRAELGPAPFVLAVGGIEPRKGSLDLVASFARFRESHPDHRLVVAGGETLFDYRQYRDEVFALAARLDVEPVVLGPVDDDRLPTLVASASAFAFPSEKEGFGLAAMEALAAGVPLVVRDLPVFREVFGATARYGADPEQLAAALSAAVDEPGDRRAPRAEAGRQLARSMSWDDAAAAHERFYAALARPSVRPG